MLILRAAAKAEAWQKDETIPPELIIRTLLDHADISNPGHFGRSGVVVHMEMLPNVQGQPGREDDQV